MPIEHVHQSKFAWLYALAYKTKPRAITIGQKLLPRADFGDYKIALFATKAMLTALNKENRKNSFDFDACFL